MNKEKKIKRRKFKFFGIIFFLVFAGLFLLILNSPLFSVKEITILGNQRVSDAEVQEFAGITIGTNIFRTFIVNNDNENFNIDKLRIERSFPNKIIIHITEKIPRAYVQRENLTSYLLIDGNGTVLSVESGVDGILPVITGLYVSEFNVGSALNTTNPKAFDNMVLLSQLIIKYEMSNVISVDLSNLEEIKLLINNIHIHIGDIQNADKKFRLANACVLTLNEEIENAIGTITVKDITIEPIFKFSE